MFRIIIPDNLPQELMMKQTLIAFALAVTAVAPAMADQALAASKNCMACHAVDKKLVGPSYKDVAAKYAGQKDAVDKLQRRLGPGSHARQPPGQRCRRQEAGRLGAVAEVGSAGLPPRGPQRKKPRNASRAVFFMVRP
jgi:cytochrome c